MGRPTSQFARSKGRAAPRPPILPVWQASGTPPPLGVLPDWRLSTRERHFCNIYLLVSETSTLAMRCRQTRRFRIPRRCRPARWHPRDIRLVQPLDRRRLDRQAVLAIEPWRTPGRLSGVPEGRADQRHRGLPNLLASFPTWTIHDPAVSGVCVQTGAPAIAANQTASTRRRHHEVSEVRAGCPFGWHVL